MSEPEEAKQSWTLPSELRGHGVVLRPLTESMLIPLYNMMITYPTIPMSGGGFKYRRTFEGFKMVMSGRMQQPAYVEFCIFDTSSDEAGVFAGMTQIGTSEHSRGTCGTRGFQIFPPWQRTHVQLSATAALLRWAFGPPPHGLGMRAVTSDSASYNAGSYVASINAGFRLQSIRKDGMLSESGLGILPLAPLCEEDERDLPRRHDRRDRFHATMTWRDWQGAARERLDRLVNARPPLKRQLPTPVDDQVPMENPNADPNAPAPGSAPPLALPEQLQSRSALLVPFNLDVHANILYEILQEQPAFFELALHERLPHVFSDFVTALRKRCEHDHWFAVFDSSRANEPLAGIAVVSELARGFGAIAWTCRLEMFVFPAYRRTHVATSATLEMLKWLFDYPSGVGVRRVEMVAFDFDAKTALAIHRLGFRFEGRDPCAICFSPELPHLGTPLPKDTIYGSPQKGNSADLLIFGLTSEDWRLRGKQHIENLLERTVTRN